MRKASLPQIRVPEDGLGEAMQALPNQSMRAYVIGRVFYGLNKARAAQAAGYSASTPDIAKVQAYRLEHDARIQTAIAEESRKLMRSQGPRSIRTLIEIRDDKSNEAKDRVKAATELLSRAGLNAVTEGHILVEHRLTTEEKDRRILELAQEIGMSKDDAQKLLIDPKNIIDAEFEEAPVSSDPTKVPTREIRQRRKNITPAEIETNKARIRAERKARAKQKYAQAQGQQTDIEDFTSDDGREGLEDLLP